MREGTSAEAIRAFRRWKLAQRTEYMRLDPFIPLEEPANPLIQLEEPMPAPLHPSDGTAQTQPALTLAPEPAGGGGPRVGTPPTHEGGSAVAT